MSKHIVAITACAAGIAHTYMAAESLEQAGKKRGDSVRVETQGSIGAENVLSEQEIKQADVVIVAADIDIDCARFAGKRVMKVRSVDAIKDANALIERALNEATLYGEKGSKAGNITLGKTENPIIKHIMSGISYMVPMCIAAGLLLAIANVFAFQKDDLGRIVNWGFDNKTAMGYFMQKLFMVGQTGFKLMIPLFAGFVAKSIADKPAIAPAMIGAYIAIHRRIFCKGDEAYSLAENRAATYRYYDYSVRIHSGDYDYRSVFDRSADCIRNGCIIQRTDNTE